MPKKPGLQSRLRPAPLAGGTPGFTPGPSAFGVSTAAGPAAPTHQAQAHGRETEAQGWGQDHGPPPWPVGPARGHMGLGGGVHRDQIKEARGAGQSGEARAHHFPLLFDINRLLCSCIFLKERRRGVARPRVPNPAWHPAFGHADHT